MNIPGALVGTTAGPSVQEIDARWLMAYAAALGDVAPEYLDTTRPDGIVAHPLFPVCYEWPLAVELRAQLPAPVAIRSVHATHDLCLYRRPRPGDRLRTTATVLAMDPRPPGAYVVTRFVTTDGDGGPVSVTDYGSIYRGVDCERAALSHAGRPRPGAASVTPGSSVAPADWSVDLTIPAPLAHTYTECARIWNPIHTDKAVAQAAGLAQIILHGTATLALAVSAALERAGLGPAAKVTRITGRFAGVVPLPSTATVRAREEATAGGRTIHFDVVGAEGRPVIRDGRLVVGTSTPAEERS